MAYTTINKSTDNFNTKLYTGNGSTQSITGVGFQPDWTWIKERNTAVSHQVFDVIRGATKRLYPDSTSAENTNANSLTAFDSDGFSLGNAGSTNGNSDTYVAWNWKGANGTASNSNGTVTSTVSANPSAGFSIVSYTANGTQGATVGHGLSSAPEMVITKDRDASGGWGVYHKGQDASAPQDWYLELNSDAGISNFTYWNDVKPDNSVVTIGNAAANNTNGRNIIMYCFHSVTGYSKFGHYIGNGNADGPFVYTGFKPAFVILKRADSGSSNWQLNDTKRDTFNLVNKRLSPSTSDAEATNYDLGDFLSNGFKLRQTDQTWNANGGRYVFMAIGQSIVGSNNTVATAR